MQSTTRIPFIAKRSALTVLLLLAIGLFGVVVVVSVHALFRLDTVEVVGTGAVFSADAAKLSTNVLFFPTKTLENDLLKNYPLFAAVRVYKRLPHSIIIEYSLRNSWGYIDSSGHTYGVDEGGVIVGEYTPPFVHPVMTFDIGTQSIGMRVTDTRVLAALSFLHALDPSIHVSSVKDLSKTAFEVTIDSMRVLVAVDGDKEEKARALLFLQNGFRIKGVLPSMVDLRYSKPIITK